MVHVLGIQLGVAFVGLANEYTCSKREACDADCRNSYDKRKGNFEHTESYCNPVCVVSACTYLGACIHSMLLI